MSIKRRKLWLVLPLVVVLLAGGLALFRTGGAPAARANSCPTLQKGSSGNAVSLLQIDLNLNYRNSYSLNYYETSAGILAVDGQFGSLTQTAVLAWQAWRGITQDGVVGPQTWGTLGGCSAPTVDGYFQPSSSLDYVTSEQGYAASDWQYGMLTTRTTTAGAWEKFRFTITNCSSLSVTIQSLSNGLYVSAELGYGTSDPRYGMLRARAASVGAWEVYTMDDVFFNASYNPSNPIIPSLRANNGSYVAEWDYLYGGSLYDGRSAIQSYGYRDRFYGPLGANGYFTC